MNQSKILPFYMAYPLPLYYQEEDTVTRDLEYLQQMYPAQAKKYQRIIADILNTMDYEGSCIYDEYPDKWQLYKLVQVVMDKIKRMEAAQHATENTDAEDSGYKSADAAKTPWGELEEFVQVLLYYEIYKKRHTNHNGILRF
ncbi:MAG: hypothetical protein NC318_07565 [Blautia sp.]|nr:hypothetical protein [Lachnoclostridium sp.]MCM1211446.1 hypothetical protein [Blautia sp.]